VVAAFGLVLTVLAGGVPSGDAAFVALTGLIASSAVHLVAALGLQSRAYSARYAMTPLLWILLVTGAFAFVGGVLRSTLFLPIGAILAWWALRAQPDPALGRLTIGSGAGTLLIAAAAASTILSIIVG
jgi:hypothetical protein